ncbi:hypothetical protein RF11_15875 [Thelohanellus kitauei]|uniref:Uncharacterized protein n=1 Tax=Thelohanellus kitauei TaxID=669202 RepID=A0A0C2IY22_THEKT|nr:hypothetical protein RF11_15875 [Thelohanellus kitauei]
MLIKFVCLVSLVLQAYSRKIFYLIAAWVQDITSGLAEWGRPLWRYFVKDAPVEEEQPSEISQAEEEEPSFEIPQLIKSCVDMVNGAIDVEEVLNRNYDQGSVI